MTNKEMMKSPKDFSKLVVVNGLFQFSFY